MSLQDIFSNTTVGSPGSDPNLFQEPESRLEHPTGISLILLSDSAVVCRAILPYPPDGRREFSSEPHIWFEPSGGQWTVRCGNRALMSDQSSEAAEILPVKDQHMIYISAPSGRYRLYSEEINRESGILHNYVVLANTTIRIGRADDNDIICTGKMMSRHHGELRFTGRQWTLSDCRSTHGIYVNDKLAGETVLKTGDTVWFPGLRLVTGCGFVSIADENRSIVVNPDKLRRVDETSQVISTARRSRSPLKNEPFNRFPRNRMSMEQQKIEIEAPPLSMDGDQLPMLLRMGSSLSMGARSAMTGNVGMLAGSVFMPILSQQYTQEEKEEYEKKRTERYRQYLDDKWQEILEEKAREEQVLTANYPPLSEVLDYPSNRRKLWERRKSDDDFLSLRIGYGHVPLSAELNFPKRRFELDSDPLMDEMYEMTEREVLLDNAPILLDMKQNTVWGTLGDRADRIAFARAMLMRLSLLYSYDEVKVVLLADPEDLKELEFVRYLPHAWDDQRTIRFVASDPSEAYPISEYITKSLDKDIDEPGTLDSMLKDRPYYVVFALSRRLFEDMEVLKAAMQQKQTCGVSVLAFFDDLPKECSILIELGKGKENGLPAENTVVYLQDLDREDDHFFLDSYSDTEAGQSMRAVADIELKLVSQAYSLPKTYTFLEMFNVGNIEHLNVLKRWQENDPSKSLEVPVGIGTSGSLFMLDLHQKYHGPHGLVAGTTGSGKSEFLITYILSLAINFHPDEVSFLLIDYKGGGLAGAFDDPRNGIHLPHLVGTITNLDGAAIARSLECIQSEMLRRQIVFNEAKSKLGEGTMDIHTYQKMYRKKAVDEPMPHLFIISDEFAELKQQQPDFLDALVSIARVGRSLGVHLILATQKPGGVVTDQIVSNTKFRVCLKVQSRSDSMDMLKRPEASELKETGRFYLQVGTNELFALGQSAWCGADYEPQDEVLVKKDESVQVIDNIGADVMKVSPPVVKSSTGQSQLVAIVRMLSDLAKAQGLQSRMLWVPPLENKIDIDSLQGEPESDPYRITYNCGMVDEPAEQDMYPLKLDLTGCGSILLTGEPGSGKTSFIQTMLYELSRRYTPEQVNYYVLDYSSRLLRFFQKLPHCGAVLTEDDDNLLDGFFNLINGLVEERKALFQQIEADSFETACQIQPLPLILVVIDNLSGLGGTRKGQKHLEILQTYIKKSSIYGIRFIITISHTNEATMRVKQELMTRIALHLKDKYDFGDALNRRLTYVPPDIKGRGLCISHDKPLELQTAIFGAEMSDKDRIRALKQAIDRLSEDYSGHASAAKLQVISEEQTYEDFCTGYKKERIPLGYSLSDGATVALPLKQFSMMSLYFGNRDSIVPVLSNILYAAVREDAKVIFMKHPDGSCFEELKHRESVRDVIADPAGVNAAVNTLLKKIGDRYNAYKEYCASRGKEPEAIDAIVPDYDALGDAFKPYFMIFERYTDVTFAAKDSQDLVQRFETAYLLAKRYRLFIFACAHPNDASLLNGAPVYTCFNPDKLSMLFGGNLKQQKIVGLPLNYPKQDAKDDFNRCVMCYQGGLYPVLMPCGVLEEKEIPEDDRPIFRQG